MHVAASTPDTSEVVAATMLRPCELDAWMKLVSCLQCFPAANLIFCVVHVFPSTSCMIPANSLTFLMHKCDMFSVLYLYDGLVVQL